MIFRGRIGLESIWSKIEERLIWRCCRLFVRTVMVEERIKCGIDYACLGRGFSDIMDSILSYAPATFVLIYLLGFLGFRFFKLLRIPGGAITGALVMVALFTSQGVDWSQLPSYVGTFFQIILGIMIGCKFSREKIPTMKSLFLPGIFVSAWMICFSLAMGFLLAKVTGLDLGTALYGSVPGGLSEMGFVAMALNLSVPVVTLFQFIRVIAVCICVPPITYRYYSINNMKNEEDTAKDLCVAGKTDSSMVKPSDILLTLLVGGVGGFTASWLGVPVGGLLGAMIAVATLRIIGIPIKELPRWALVFAQIGLGAYLGTTFTPDVIATLISLLFPTLVFSIVIVLNGIVLGLLVHKIFGWNLVTSLLATAAAGASQMSAIALDMDADAITVSIIQSMRLGLILLLMPTLITFLIR